MIPIVIRDAVIISLMDTFTSFLAGITIFSILGNLAHESGKNVTDVVSAGTGLAFVSYPDAIAKFQYVPQVNESNNFSRSLTNIYVCFRFQVLCRHVLPDVTHARHRECRVADRLRRHNPLWWFPSLEEMARRYRHLSHRFRFGIGLHHSRTNSSIKFSHCFSRFYFLLLCFRVVWSYWISSITLAVVSSFSWWPLLKLLAFVGSTVSTDSCVTLSSCWVLNWTLTGRSPGPISYLPCWSSSFVMRWQRIRRWKKAITSTLRLLQVSFVFLIRNGLCNYEHICCRCWMGPSGNCHPASSLMGSHRNLPTKEL